MTSFSLYIVFGLDVRLWRLQNSNDALPIFLAWESTYTEGPSERGSRWFEVDNVPGVVCKNLVKLGTPDIVREVNPEWNPTGGTDNFEKLLKTFWTFAVWEFDLWNVGEIFRDNLENAVLPDGAN